MVREAAVNVSCAGGHHSLFGFGKYAMDSEHGLNAYECMGALACCVGLTIFTEYLYGRLNRRWQQSDRLFVLHSITKELMILGVISFSIFFTEVQCGPLIGFPLTGVSRAVR
jgi:hypothetical protein